MHAAQTVGESDARLAAAAAGVARCAAELVRIGRSVDPGALQSFLDLAHPGLRLDRPVLAEAAGVCAALAEAVDTGEASTPWALRDAMAPVTGLVGPAIASQIRGQVMKATTAESVAAALACFSDGLSAGSAATTADFQRTSSPPVASPVHGQGAGGVVAGRLALAIHRELRPR